MIVQTVSMHFFNFNFLEFLQNTWVSICVSRTTQLVKLFHFSIYYYDIKYFSITLWPLISILAILRHLREIINISWWHVISWCTAFYFLRTTGKRDASSPSNNKFQACKAQENISAKLLQNIALESLLIAASRTLFKPRIFDLILEQLRSSCMFHLWYTHFLCQSKNLFTAYL